MALLTRFQFPSNRWYDKLGQLSGGERRRLQLLQILAARPNVLLLDEPSNDMDLITLAALEEYLTEAFEGCLVVVSHDNFFMNRVAEHLFVFQGDGSGTVRDFQGSYSEFLDHRRDLQADEQAADRADRAAKNKADKSSDSSGSGSGSSGSKSSKSSKSSSSKEAAQSSTAAAPSSQPPLKPLSYNERKELGKAEREVARLAALLAECEAQILSSSSSGSGKGSGKSGSGGASKELAALHSKAELARAQLREKEALWVQLAERDGL
jgi:ATP-binding cassette subfamily F protein uup